MPLGTPPPETKSNKNSIFTRFLLIVLPALLLSSIAILFYSHTLNMSEIFKADALYIPTLYKDLTQGGPLANWYLTPAPYVFPDWVSYFTAYAITQSHYHAMLLTIVFQLSILAIFVHLINSGYQDKFRAYIHTMIGLAITLACIVTTDLPSYAQLVQSAHHSSAFIMQLVCYWIVLKWLFSSSVKHKHLYSIGLLIITILMTFSDKIFFIWHSSPLIIFLCYTSITNNKLNNQTKFLIFYIITGTIIGLLLYKALIPNQTDYHITISPEDFYENFTFISEMFSAYFYQYPIIISSIILWHILLLGILINTGIQKRTLPKDKKSLFAIYVLASTSSTLFALLIGDIRISYRYLLPIFLWPMLFWFLAIPIIKNKILLSALFLLTMVTSASKLNTKKMQFNNDFYPEKIQCLDAIAQRYSLKNGIAQYWDAKPISVLSKQNLNIAQVNNDLRYYNWITSTAFHREAYDFAVIDQNSKGNYLLDESKIKRINGSPIYETLCSDDWKIIVYPKNALHTTPKFLLQQSYKIDACELPSRIGERLSDCSISSDSNETGYVTFGPYLPLPAGRYKAEILFSSDSPIGERVGHWDIVLALPNRLLKITNGVFNGTKSIKETVTIDFSISQQYHDRSIEIRNFSQTGGALRIYQLTLQRVSN